MNTQVITKQHVDEKISYLKDLAKKNGWTIRFIRHKKNYEDGFVIFLYNKTIKPSGGYVVGFDGDYLAAPESMTHFDGCIRQSVLFITDENFRKHFTN